MKFTQTNRLQLKQKLQLNQKLQHSLRVLHLSSQDLAKEIEDWVNENPLLMLPQNDVVADVVSYGQHHMTQHIGGDDAEDIWSVLAEEENFNQFLHKQVCEYPIDDEVVGRIHFLIDCLDDKGYLADDLNDLIEYAPLQWQDDKQLWQQALSTLQQFEPAGVAAKNLQESLLLQLSRQALQASTLCAMQIVQSHLCHMGGSRHQNIVRFRQDFPEYSEQETQMALELIAKLNPYPAYGFASSEPTAYIQPDVWVQEVQGQWVAMHNEAAWIKPVLNEEIMSILQQDADGIWQNKRQDALAKLDSLNKRQDTVLRIAQYIVDKQQDFFVFGDIALLPMLLTEAAEALQLAESTVSRAINQKYLACSLGVFPFAHFFSHAVDANDADGKDGVSKHTIKVLIKNLIHSENKHQPLSDKALVELLEKQGIVVARRTVTKYRERLNIPSSSQRKQK